MADPTPRLIKVGDAVRHLINVALLPRTTPTPANDSNPGHPQHNGVRRTAPAVP